MPICFPSSRGIEDVEAADSLICEVFTRNLIRRNEFDPTQLT